MTTFGQPVIDTPTPLTPDRLELRRRLSQEELDEFVEAGEAKDIVETADALTDRLYVLLGDYIEAGLGDLLEPLFDEVQASNMSKVCTTLQEATLTQVTRRDEQGEPMHVKKVGDYFVVYRSSDGKVMKNVNYFKPDLKTIVENFKKQA